MTLCDIDSFTLDTNHSLEMLHTNMRVSVITLGKNASSSSSSYNELTFCHKRLGEIMTKDTKIKNKLTLIQLPLLPHIEIIQKEIFFAKGILNKDTHFSHITDFIDLPVKLEI